MTLSTAGLLVATAALVLRQTSSPTLPASTPTLHSPDGRRLVGDLVLETKASASGTSVESGTSDGPAPLTGASSLMSRRSSARDWRVFVEWAKQHPQAGGLYYAAATVNACGDTQAVLSHTRVPEAVRLRDSGTLARDRERALQQLAERCGSFVPDEVDIRAPGRLLDEGVRRGDRLAITHSRWQELMGAGVGGSVAEAAYSEVLATKDPLLIERVGLQLTAITSMENNGRISVAGSWFGVMEVQAAWILASCSFGADCGPTTDLVIRTCAFYGECLPNLQDVIQASYVRENGDAAWSRVQEAAGLIAHAVERGDSSAFFPRRTSERSTATK